MTWSEAISALRREILSRIEQVPYALFGWTLSAKSSEMGDADQVETADGEDSQRPVRRIEPWGHRGRAPSKVRTFWIRIGSSNVLFMGVAPTKGYGPSDLADGETALYCSQGGTEVRLDKDGNVKINAATGKDVVVNGGSLQVARKTDKTIADATMTTWIADVTAKFNAAAGPMVSAPASITPPTDFGIINAGAAHFKG